ncbi:MAG: division/cell wall cluster transcriptional repressor MraZ [Clostridia bacterium]|nr:division/cell wall cluster transcriptional repressor MraZ [Clostridia bacterium]
MGFVGEYFHRLDGKNRIRIPAKLKKEMGDAKFCFAKGTDHCVFIFPQPEIEKIEERLALIPMSDTPGTNAVRAFNKSISYPEEDSQGRIVLSPDYKKYAGIKDEVVFIGCPNRIEIWSKENYDAQFGGDEDMNKLYASMGL